MKLKQIEVFKLWGYKNIRWDLNEDVNILSGSNGSGKSVVLEIVNSLLNYGLFPSVEKQSKWMCEKVKITFDDDKSIEYKYNYFTRFDEELVQRYKKLSSRFDDAYYKNYLYHVTVNRDCTEKEKEVFQDKFNNFIIENKNQLLHKNKENLCSDMISTFDCQLDDFTLKDDSRKGKTTLDDVLEKLELKFTTYRMNIYQGIVDDAEKVQEVHEFSNIVKRGKTRLKKFESVCSNFFDKEKGYKTLILGPQGIEFKLNKDVDNISTKSLSSGEKQLLIILITVFLDVKNSNILILDEPEISLNLDWQKVLISSIMELNPEIQLLIASHSPGLLLSGWKETVKNIDDLIF